MTEEEIGLVKWLAREEIIRAFGRLSARLEERYRKDHKIGFDESVVLRVVDEEIELLLDEIHAD